MSPAPRPPPTVSQFGDELRQVLVLTQLSGGESGAHVSERLVRTTARLAADAGLLAHLRAEQRGDVVRAFEGRVRVAPKAPAPAGDALYVVVRGQLVDGPKALDVGDAYVGAGWPKVGDAGAVAARAGGPAARTAGPSGAEVAVLPLVAFEEALKQASLRVALDASPALATLPSQARHHLARNMEHEVVARNAVIFKQGDVGDRFYAILSGSVDVHVLKLSFEEDVDDETFESIRELEEEAGREKKEDEDRERERSAQHRRKSMRGLEGINEDDEDFALVQRHALAPNEGTANKTAEEDDVHVPRFEDLSKVDIRRMSTERRVSSGVRRTAAMAAPPSADERRKIQMFEREAQYGAMVATLREGDCFGELALLRDDSRSATIVADCDVGCELAAVDRKTYLESVAYSRSIKGSGRIAGAPNVQDAGGSRRRSAAANGAPDADSGTDGEVDNAAEAAGDIRSFSDEAVDILRTPHEARSIEDVSRLEELFASFAFFARLPKQLRREVCKSLKHAHHATESRVCQQGDPSNEFYIIIRGMLSVIVDGVEVARLGPGEAVGETGLLKGAARGATLEALAPTDIACLAREDYRRVLRRHDMTRIAESGKFLCQVSGWKDMCPHPTLLRIAYQCRFQEHPSGYEIIKQGDSKCRNVYFLVQGSFEMSTQSEDHAGGGRLVEAMVGPGSAVGELQAIKHEPSDVTVTCHGPCKILSLAGIDVTKRLQPESLSRVLAIAEARVESRKARRQRYLKARDGVGVRLNVLAPRDGPISGAQGQLPAIYSDLESPSSAGVSRSATPGPMSRSATPGPMSRSATPGPTSRSATPGPKSFGSFW